MDNSEHRGMFEEEGSRHERVLEEEDSQHDRIFEEEEQAEALNACHEEEKMLVDSKLHASKEG
jgi:hypothetical protein